MLGLGLGGLGFGTGLDNFFMKEETSFSFKIYCVELAVSYLIGIGHSSTKIPVYPGWKNSVCRITKCSAFFILYCLDK